MSLGLVFLVYWLWSSTPSIWPEPANIQAPAISAEQAHIIKYDTDGKKLWELEARAIATGDVESTAKEVSLRFFDSEGRETLTVLAPQARLHNRTGNIELIGVIRAHGSEFSFTTENLYWDNQKRMLSTQSLIRIERDDFVLTGRGLEYFAETGLATILNEARLILRSRTDRKE
jgi:LPS export ABC transporter protein LptC